jgi:GH25 family lysozyme M1 (1,4-beta-N-acetylmuramidase)
MADTIFADVSEWQTRADFAQLRTVSKAVGVRVCYGTTLDKCMPLRRTQVRGANFHAVLWYLFLRPNKEIAAQVATFVSCIPTLLYGEAAFVDWESDPGANGAWATEAQRDQALALMDKHYGKRTGVYASALVSVPQNRPRWMASYGISKPQSAYDVWQYTNGKYTSGRYSPVDFPSIGHCDTNVFHGPADTLAKFLSPTGDDDMADLKRKRVVLCPDQRIAIPGQVARWVFARDGGVEALGGAPFFGSYWNLPEAERQGGRLLDDAAAVGPRNEDGYVIFGEDDSFYGPFNPVLWARIQPHK